MKTREVRAKSYFNCDDVCDYSESRSFYWKSRIWRGNMLSKKLKFSKIADRDPQDSRMALITLLLQKLAPQAQKVISTGTILSGLALFKNTPAICGWAEKGYPT